MQRGDHNVSPILFGEMTYYNHDDGTGDYYIDYVVKSPRFGSHRGSRMQKRLRVHSEDITHARQLSKGHGTLITFMEVMEYNDDCDEIGERAMLLG